MHGLQWGGLPGTIDVTDDCATSPIAAFGGFFFTSWQLPEDDGRTCTTTMRARNLEGVASTVAGRYQLVVPH
jgi:muramidase (phage lysozyme)